MIDNLRLFKTGFYNGASHDPVVMAKDVVDSFMLREGDKCAFDMIYGFGGLHHIQGYIYKLVNKHHGVITVDILGSNKPFRVLVSYDAYEKVV